MNLIDELITNFDTAVRTLLPPENRGAMRTSPAEPLTEAALSAAEKKHSAGLMRVNHAGEVCAQALYQGQALTAKLEHTRGQMAQAAAEEIDHLAWCEQRLKELEDRPSLLNLFWYTHSFLIGAIAGMAGDNYSLGFVAETEKQVSSHLQTHLKELPKQDQKSRAIVQQMYEDESLHAETAVQAGAADLSTFIKQIMNLTSKALTKLSYYI